MKFKVGDPVIGIEFIKTPEYNEMQGTVVAVGPAKARYITCGTLFMADYAVSWADGKVLWCKKQNLRKPRPPEQPSAFSYDEIISMCNGTDIRPTETQIREGLKGILEPFGSGGVMARSLPIEGYGGKYFIYEDGRVLSLASKEPRFLSPQIQQVTGYYMINLRGKQHRIHALVAKHFVSGYKPGLEVNHKNAIKTDNRAENLEWITKAENIQHAIKAGLIIKKPVKAIHIKTGEELRFESATKGAKHVNGCLSHISKCCLGKPKYKSHMGYKWSYV